MRDDLDHRAVDRARPAAAARDEHRLFRRVKAEGACAVRARRRQYLGADRIARHIGLALRENALRVLHADRDCRCKTRKNAVRHTRKDILLLHESRHTRKTRR